MVGATLSEARDEESKLSHSDVLSGQAEVWVS